MSSFDEMMYKNKSLNEKIDHHNKQLGDQGEKMRQLEHETRMSRLTNEIILENQKKELDKKQRSNDAKGFVVNFETFLKKIPTVNDPVVKYAIVCEKGEIIENALLKCKSDIEELSDKKYTQELLEKFQDLKRNYQVHQQAYQQTIFPDFSIGFADFQKLTSKHIQKPDEPEPIEDNDFSMFAFGLVGIGGLIGAAYLGSLKEKFAGFIALAFGLYFLIKAQGIWNAKKQYNTMRQEYERKLASFNQSLNVHKKVLTEHPYHKRADEVNRQYPEYLSLVTELSNILGGSSTFPIQEYFSDNNVVEADTVDVMKEVNQNNNTGTKGVITLSWKGQYFLFDIKTKIFVNDTLHSTGSTKNGFNIDIPISSENMKIKLTVAGLASNSYNLKSLDQNKSYLMGLEYSRMGNCYSDQYTLNEY